MCYTENVNWPKFIKLIFVWAEVAKKMFSPGVTQWETLKKHINGKKIKEMYRQEKNKT